MIGRQLGHYLILERLGAGGMGEVYRAEDTRLRRHVALKVLSPELAGSQERLSRFQREAEALAALDHPHIVHIYSVEESDGVPFLTMQLVRGETLSRQIPEGGMAVDRLLDLAVPLVDALRAAHERGIVHRDLKPANVMVDEEGRVKILDFGLAKLRLPEVDDGDSSLPTATMTEVGVVMGTVPYMSPEQLQGRPADARSDLFSFGIVLYEMATGGRPFRGEDSASLVSSILRDDPAPLEQLRSGLPARLSAIIARCLEKRPESRFASARELLGELTRLRGELASGRTVVTRPAAPPLQRRLVLRALGIVLLVALVATLGVATWSRMHTTSGPATAASTLAAIDSLAVLPLVNYSGDPEQEYFSDGMTDALIGDLSKIGALTVIARSSAMRYKKSEKSLSEIASELGVKALVEGSVQREGDLVVIRVQVVDAATESNLWSDRFERHLTSVLALQSEVAQAIAREIRVQVTPGEQGLLARAQEVDPEAYEAYLQGRFHVNRLTPGDLDAAQRYFELALEKDPDYAQAQAGIAMVWTGRGQFHFQRPAVTQPKARAAAARAVEMDDNLAEAHYQLALVRTWIDWDWEAAEVEFRRAIDLQPSFADVRGYYAHYLMIMQRPAEAEAQMQRALVLDPLNPLMMALHGVMLLRWQRYDEAEAVELALLKISPGHPFALSGLAEIHFQRGELEEASELLREMILATNGPEAAQAWKDGYAEGGWAEAHLRWAEWERLRRWTKDYCPMGIVIDLVTAGHNEEALDCLELTFKGRSQNMPYLGLSLSSLLEPLRDEPRVQEILRQMRLPSEPSRPVPEEEPAGAPARS